MDLTNIAKDWQPDPRELGLLLKLALAFITKKAAWLFPHGIDKDELESAAGMAVAVALCDWEKNTDPTMAFKRIFFRQCADQISAISKLARRRAVQSDQGTDSHIRKVTSLHDLEAVNWEPPSADFSDGVDERIDMQRIHLEVAAQAAKSVHGQTAWNWYILSTIFDLSAGKIQDALKLTRDEAGNVQEAVRRSMKTVGKRLRGQQAE